MSFNAEHSPIQTSGQIECLSLLKLKIWWKTLTVDQKQALCKIDSSSILSGLVNVANKAIYLCRMNQAYKKKDLMSKTTIKAQNGETQSQIVEFNLIGKEIVENGWEDLLSCFYISIAQGQKPKEGDSKEDVSQDQTSMSYIGVKREKLEFVLDLLWNCIPSFARGDKPVYSEETLLELFPSILDYSSQINVSTLNLKPDLRVLFENLIAFSIMLEHQIYLGYFKSSTSHKEQKEMSQAVADKFNCLSTQLGLEEGKFITPLMVKTLSQLERETEKQRTKKPDALKISGHLDIEKPCQSLASKAALDQTSCSSHQDKSASSSSTDSIRQFYEERVSAYDGFFMDDLVVEFERADNLLTNEAFLDADEEEQLEVPGQEERKFTKVEQEEVHEDHYQSSDDEDSLGQSSNDSFYEQPSSRMNEIPRFPFYQGQHHNANVEYYPSYFPQQHPPMLPHNFGMPMAVPFNQSNEYMIANFDRYAPVYQGKDNSFSDNSVYAQRKKSYESQSSQSSDRDYFPAGQFDSQFSKGNLVDNKAKRHYARPQLPPRLQKKKEQMLRN